jgi:hypothetical protein
VTAVPDYVEPVEAWRVWAVVEVGGLPRLRSVYHEVRWSPGTACAAACMSRRRPLRRLWRRSRSDHGAPVADCTCGIYASADLPTVARYLEPPLAASEVCRVLGRVALWGKVVECEHGWRAGFAYPTRLYVPAELDCRRARSFLTDDLAFELAAYGVPVETVEAELPTRVPVALR